MSGEIQKITVDHKMLEHACSICNFGFNLAEDVYPCSRCGGYHHIQCWEKLGVCPQETIAPISAPPSDDFKQWFQSRSNQEAPVSTSESLQPQSPEPRPQPVTTANLVSGEVEREKADELRTASLAPAEPHKLKANRRVLEQCCAFCNLGFSLAQEVYYCPTCDGYHHLHCWETTGKCPRGTVSSTQEQVAPARDPARERYDEWRRATLGEESVKPAQPQMVGIALQTTEGATLAPDERQCPNCDQVIKQQALKCRHCGQIFDESLRSAEAIHPITASEIEDLANDALKYSIIGIFCFGIILAPMAIYRGGKALGLLNQYPNYAAKSSARGKAIAGIIIGVIVGFLSIIGFFSIVSGR